MQLLGLVFTCALALPTQDSVDQSENGSNLLHPNGHVQSTSQDNISGFSSKPLPSILADRILNLNDLSSANLQEHSQGGRFQYDWPDIFRSGSTEYDSEASSQNDISALSDESYSSTSSQNPDTLDHLIYLLERVDMLAKVPPSRIKLEIVVNLFERFQYCTNELWADSKNDRDPEMVQFTNDLQREIQKLYNRVEYEARGKRNKFAIH